MKKLLLLLAFVALHSSAQDVIVKKDGSTILSKVIEINTADIKYKKFSNQNGPTYTVNRSEVMFINYENGEKDDFTNDSSTSNGSEPGDSRQLLNTAVGENNAELIAMYNNYDNHYTQKKQSKEAHFQILINHVGKESVLNNTDLEMNFIPSGEKWYGLYYNYWIKIMLTNLTDKTIYIDKGNSFCVYRTNQTSHTDKTFIMDPKFSLYKYIPDGMCHTYYDNTVTASTHGSSTSVGLNLGGVARASGVGGPTGALASGITVGKSDMNSTTTVTYKERIISIPPHANCIIVEESFGGPQTHDITVGEETVYTEENTPLKKDIIFTYSKDPKFESYGTIKATLFLAKRIGAQKITDKDEADKILSNQNPYTLWSCERMIEKKFLKNPNFGN